MEVIAFLNSPYPWLVLGIGLIGLELLMPGVFFAFVGAAALVLSAVIFLIPALPFWLDALILLGLLGGAIYAGIQVYPAQESAKPSEDLNRRSSWIIGKPATISQIDAPGSGKVKIGDGLWRAQWQGDFQIGQTVVVDNVVNTTVVVKAA